MYLHECVEARRVQTDQRWDAGVGAGDGKPGSSARVWRSLDVDQLADVEPVERGQRDTTNEEECRDGRSGPHDQPPPETRYGGFEYFPHPRGVLNPAIAIMHYSTAIHYR
jgi:hypothetical protein